LSKVCSNRCWRSPRAHLVSVGWGRGRGWRTRRLAATADIMAARWAADRSAECEQWCVDNWDAVAAEVAAAQNVSQGVASHQLMVAMALRERLPRMAEVFATGVVSYRLVCAIVARTRLVHDAQARAQLDAAIAADDTPVQLDGEEPARPGLSKPLREMTIAEALAPDPLTGPPRTNPAVVIGGGIMPAPLLAAKVVSKATIRPLIHPGDAPPESHYVPSPKLADFVRCRDMTCRFPGCDEPGYRCDLDHTIPYPAGPTCASNLGCLCRKHQRLAELLFTHEDRETAGQSWLLPAHLLRPERET